MNGFSAGRTGVLSVLLVEPSRDVGHSVHIKRSIETFGDVSNVWGAPAHVHSSTELSAESETH
jgi:hypothetical protein